MGLKKKILEKIDDVYKVLDTYSRFDQKYDVFARSVWDPHLKERVSPRIEEAVKKFSNLIVKNVDGFRLKDFAFMRSGWTFAASLGFEMSNRGLLSWNSIERKYEPTSVKIFRECVEAVKKAKNKFFKDPSYNSEIVKNVAKALGADLVGVAPLDERWIYSRCYFHDTGESKEIVFENTEEPYETKNRLVIPSRVRYAIVMIVKMSEEILSHPNDAFGDGFIALGYSKCVFLAVSMAEFLRGLGFTAIPCVNDTALSIPLAVSAGLGQAGRCGLLITPEFGSAIRICKVFTDLPLKCDKPVDYGIVDYCRKCKRCAESCPVNAIPYGDRTFEPKTKSNNPGVLKWSIDPEKCVMYWRETGVTCSICIAVCPFTRNAFKKENKYTH